MKKKYFYTALLSFLSLGTYSQTLTPGDIVVIGYASDTGTPTTAYTEFSWVPLVNLEAGNKIYFTDAGYNTFDGNFMGTGLSDEILLRYVVPMGGIASGTVMTLTEMSIPADYTVITGTKFGNDFNSLLSLPNAGDQITVFQSTDDETVSSTFAQTSFNAIFMVNGSSLSFTALTTSTAGVTPVFNLDNVTNLAPGLTNGVNALAVGSGPLEADETDNARYVGITTGTKQEILAAVTQLSNWSRHDVAFGNDLAFGSTPNGWTTNGATLYTVQGLSVPALENNLDKIILYPNPAAKTFSINNQSGLNIQQINIYNNNGQIIKRCNASQDRFDVSDLTAGIYFVEITSENASITKKLIRY